MKTIAIDFDGVIVYVDDRALKFEDWDKTLKKINKLNG